MSVYEEQSERERERVKLRKWRRAGMETVLGDVGGLPRSAEVRQVCSNLALGRVLLSDHRLGFLKVDLALMLSTTVRGTSAGRRRCRWKVAAQAWRCEAFSLRGAMVCVGRSLHDLQAWLPRQLHGTTTAYHEGAAANTRLDRTYLWD